MNKKNEFSLYLILLVIVFIVILQIALIIINKLNPRLICIQTGVHGASPYNIHNKPNKGTETCVIQEFYLFERN